MPSKADVSSGLGSPVTSTFPQQQGVTQRFSSDPNGRRSVSGDDDQQNLPLPATTPGEVGIKSDKIEFLEAPKHPRPSNSDGSVRGSLAGADDLLPARLPPRYSYLDLFPFSLLLKPLIRRGKQVKGKKATRLRAKLHHDAVSHNLPLEISLYLVRFHWSSFLTFYSTKPTELVHRRASKPQSYRCCHNVYARRLALNERNEINGSPTFPSGLVECPEFTSRGFDWIGKDSDHAHSLLVCAKMCTDRSDTDCCLQDIQFIFGPSRSFTASSWYVNGNLRRPGMPAD